MVVGDMEIRLRAEFARLQQDLDRARQTVSGAMGRISANVGEAMKMLAGFAAALSVGVFVNFVKDAIDAVDALNDMSVRTKVSIEDLAGLAYAAKLGDTSLDGVASSITKLGQNIGKDGAKFRELGITATEPLEAFKQLADVFKGIQDPQQRAAFGAEALGKSWQDAAVLLDGGSEGIAELIAKGKDLSGISEQVAGDAGAFNDKLDELGFAAQGAGTRIAAGLLPTLNKIVEAMSSSAVKGDTLKGAIAALSGTLKILYTVGVGVVEVFSTMGRAIGAAAAMTVQVLSGDFAGAWQTYKDVGSDIADGWVDAARRIGIAWSASSNSVAQEVTETGKAVADSAAKVAGFLNSSEIEAARKKAADAAKKITDESLKWYANIRDASIDHLMQLEAERNGQVALSGEEKKRIEILNDLLKHGKNLSEQQRSDIVGWADATVVLSKYNNQLAESKKLREQREGEAYGDVSSAREQAQSLRDQIEYYGLAEEAVLKLQAAEIKRGLDDGYIDDIERGRLQGLLDATNGQIALQGQLSAMKSESTFWTGLEDTAHQTFLSIANGSKDTATRLKETFKNVFFDWLYQMTLKKWVISVQGALTTTGASAGGLVGSASSLLGAAGGVSSLAGISGSIGSIAGIASVLGSVGGIATGALQTAGALLTGQIAVGQTLSAGLAALGTGSAAGAVAGLSSLAGVLGPIALGVAGGVALLNKAFGHGAKTVTGTSITGTLTPTGATAATVSQWEKKGGWFSSTKRGTDTTQFTAAQNGALADTYKAILDVSKLMGDTVGVNTDKLSTRVQRLNVSLTGLNTEAEQLKAISDFFITVGDTIATELVPNIAQFQAEGETLGATLQRVALEYATVDAALSSIGKAMGVVGAAGIEARERLIAASGGLESFVSSVSYFQQNFLSEAEQIGPVQNQVADSLAALGLSGLKTNDQFKAAALGIDVSTQAGADLFAKMMALAPAFKSVADYAAELTGTVALTESQIRDQGKGLLQQLDEITKSEAERLAIQRAGIADVNKAYFDQVQAAKAVVSTKDALASAYDREATAAKAVIEKSKTWVTTLNGLNASQVLGGQSTLTPMQKYAEALAQYEKTVTAANAGDETARAGWSAAQQAYLAASQVVNGADAKYVADFARTLADNEQALKWASAQVDLQQASYDALEAQVKGLTTINDSVLTVAQAIANLHTAMGVSDGLGVKFTEVPAVTAMVASAAPTVDYSRYSAASNVGSDALVAEVKALREEVKGLRADAVRQTVVLKQSNEQANASAAATVVQGVEKSAKKTVEKLEFA